jgi:hypothetical protein
MDALEAIGGLFVAVQSMALFLYIVLLKSTIKKQMANEVV